VVLSGETAIGDDPWESLDQWWLNTTPVRTLNFTDGASHYPVRVERDGAAWRIEGVTGAAERLDGDRVRVSLDGVRRTVLATQDQHVITLRDGAQTWRLTLPDPLSADDDEEDAGDRLIAPIPGQVTQVSVKPGDRVTRGDILVVMEAMKTVFRLTAPADAVVAAVSCTVGETVQEGQTLVAFGEGEV
jgi:3-methylcrotonyl-CoA carboxylase alpha subunit